jgi:PAS domain S-box-containing protein
MTRILVVEDSPTQAEKVRLILEGEGFEVETARDGQEGKEKLEASTFDLVVSDIVMPRLSGYELCRWVKSEPKTRDIPVILLTALNDPMDIIQALEAGADNFISKPYEPDYLVARIRSILDNRRLRPEGKLSVNVEMLFMGRRFTIGSGKEQILGLLLSAFEDMVRTNRDLRVTQAELSAAKEKLEEYALKLEDRVQVSEEMYGTLVKQASDAILLFEEGVIIEANLHAAALAGRPVSEIIGRRAADFVPAAQRGGMRTPRDKVEVERSVQAGDFVVERPDGSTVEAEASVSRVEVQGHNLNLVLLRDVTEKRHAERRAAAQQEITQILAESYSLSEAAPRLVQAMCTTLRWDQGAFWQVDRETEALCGLARWPGPSAGETERGGASDSFDPGAELARSVWDSREATWIVDVARDSGIPRPGVVPSEGPRTRVGFPIVSDHKIYGLIELLSRQILQPDEDLLEKLTSFGSQIGQFVERRRAEEALAKSELHFRSLIENVQDIITIIDLQGIVLFDSPAVERILGHPPGEYVGKSAFEFIHPEDAAGVQAALRRAMDNPALPQTTLYRARHADGSWREMEAIGKLMMAEGLPEFVINSRDVTKSRALEQQFQQAQKMEAVGQLAGGVAHDFNNLLTVILGYGSLLAARFAPDAPGREEVDEILRASERAAALTQQLLAFGRKQVFEPVVLCVNELIANFEKMLGRLIGEDVNLVTRLDPFLGNVRADRGQLEQVIMNLAVNARDAMPKGGNLTIETANADLDESYAQHHVTAQPGRYVMVAVSDTGTGMDGETQAHIFEPFFTTKEKGKGTGLGLSTAYGIVKQSGGSIWVYSEPGKGTTFKVYLPWVEEAGPAAPPRLSDSLPTLGTETILIVEDEPAIRALSRQVLERSGYHVLEAGDGKSALELLRTHPEPIHLLLTDLVMPAMGGTELASRLQDKYPTIRVLFMSGYTDDGVVRNGMLGPGRAFLQKPFTPAMLVRKIRDVLA